MPLQEAAFEEISPEMLQREARQYLLRVKRAQESTAAALASDTWICGDDSLALDRLCRRLQAEVARLESMTA